MKTTFNYILSEEVMNSYEQEIKNLEKTVERLESIVDCASEVIDNLEEINAYEKLENKKLKKIIKNYEESLKKALEELEYDERYR